MRKLIGAASLLLLHIIGNAQVIEFEKVDSTSVPGEVRQAAKKITLGSEIVWYRMGFIFEARYASGATQYQAYFFSDGTLRRIRSAVSINRVPKDLIREIRKDHAGFKITAAFIDEVNGKPNRYVFYLANGETKREVTADYYP
jgi:hypothetical protein